MESHSGGLLNIALASRCDVATAGPFGPFDRDVRTLDQGCIGALSEPKYHGFLCVNASRNSSNTVEILIYPGTFSGSIGVVISLVLRSIGSVICS